MRQVICDVCKKAHEDLIEHTVETQTWASLSLTLGLGVASKDGVGSIRRDVHVCAEGQCAAKALSLMFDSAHGEARSKLRKSGEKPPVGR